MISVIGIPIALLIAALPGLFVIYFLSRLIYLLFAKPGSAVHGGMALGLALVILAVPPVLVNSWLDKKADALIAQDIDHATGNPNVRSLAVVAARGYYTGGQCDELCKRLLLNGQVDEFIMWREAEPFDEAKLPQTGQRYRFVRQASCKAPDGLISGDPLGLAKDDEGMKGRSLDDLIVANSAAGNCLVSDTVPFSRADAVLMLGAVTSNRKSARPGLDMLADTVSGIRLTLLVRKDGGFVPVYRKTSTSIRKLWYLVVPGMFDGGGMKLYPSLARRTEYRGGAKRYSSGISLASFVEDRLGLKLAVRNTISPLDELNQLDEILATAKELTSAQIALVERFFDNIEYRKPVDESQMELGSKILSNMAIPVSYPVARMVDNLPKADRSRQQEFADLLFQRLEARLDAVPGSTKSQGYNSSQFPQVVQISRAIAALPQGAIAQRHFDGLVRLARNEVLRTHGYSALKRLADFGEQGADQLFWLIEDADRMLARNSRRNRDQSWQHPFLAGLGGLCQMALRGEVPGNGAKRFIALAKAEKVAVFGAYAKMVAGTLLGFGASPQQVREVLLMSGSNKPEQVDKVISRAQAKIDCSY
ncbi:MAG: hypothetical protein KDJ66_14750 [Nitratireductor sp.]|nr:hypothetical protein [Nitratireductor sp.]